MAWSSEKCCAATRSDGAACGAREAAGPAASPLSALNWSGELELGEVLSLNTDTM